MRYRVAHRSAAARPGLTQVLERTNHHVPPVKHSAQHQRIDICPDAQPRYVATVHRLPQPHVLLAVIAVPVTAADIAARTIHRQAALTTTALAVAVAAVAAVAKAQNRGGREQVRLLSTRLLRCSH